MFTNSVSKQLRSCVERVRRLPYDRSGVTAIEYTLIAVGIGLLLAGLLSSKGTFGSAFNTAWTTIAGFLSAS